MSAFAVGLDPSDLIALERAFTQAPDIAQEELTGFMHEATQHLAGEVQERTPTAHHTLRASIIGDVQPIEGGLGVEGVVGTSLAYAMPVELGSKPHMPPVEPLVDWAKVKFGYDDKEARSVAWRVARSIAQRGTLAVGMFHRTMAANREQIAEEFRAVVERIVERMRGAS